MIQVFNMKTKDHFLEKEKLSELAEENCKLRKNFADITMYLAEIEKLYLELYKLCFQTTLKQDKKKKKK